MSLVLTSTQIAAKPSAQVPHPLVTEPRPPVPGSESGCHEEEAVTQSHVTSHARLQPLRPAPWKQPLASKMAPSPQAGSEAGSVNRGFEPEGSADVTPPFSESNSANSGPAYLKWAENLHNLLSDPDGVALYKTYMKNENVGELLDFWFACEGLKRLPSDQNEKIYQLIKVINRKFLRSKIVPIGAETRQVITDKIATKSGTDQTIFDTAQCEVEERMTRTTYRNFLASDMYLSYIQSAQVSSPSEPGLSPKLSAESSLSGQPGLSVERPGQDDSGSFSQPPTSSLGDLDRTRSSQSTRAASSALSTIPSDSTSGVSESSSTANVSVSLVTPGGPNTSVNTSQAPALASISGVDMGSDEPVSMTQYSMSHSATLPTLHENSELSLEPDLEMGAPSLPASLMSSLTASNINLSARKRHHIKNESQGGSYLSEWGGPGGGGRVPHPYHAYNSAYNPVSRQESELQSQSSDAQTTDDNMSSFTDSSSHFSNHYRLQHNKKYLRRQARKIQEQSRQNRENYLPQASSFIPRTERIPVEASRQPSPAEFAEILIKKLEKVKREQELDEKLNKKLAEDAQSMVSQGSNRSLADILREKLIVTDDMDGDQSILDDHVSRIWTDKTPLRSPGDPSGRPRSPGYGGRSRGHPGAASRSAMGPPPPRRSVAPGQAGSHGAQRGQTQPRYHQDLAYYDLGPGNAGPVQQPGGGAVNDRVREWMLDVERHSADQDQRSQHSKANLKTSPRSNRMKSGGHRSASQERLMSTSWQGQPGYPQMAAEAEKRRLGASLVMPPPSQTNTLRRPAQPGPAAASEITVAVYTFSHEKGEPMPYRIKIPSKKVTLRHVKDFLPKKGAFRFYFKTEVEGDMCYEEETEDSHPVPLWEGKILVQCRLVD